MRAAFLVAVLGLVACGGAQRAAPADPQACVVGSYEGRGLDEAGTTWTLTLSLRIAGPDVVGSYHWVGSDGSVGDEQIRGHADCAAGTFEWSGSTATGGSVTEEIVTGHYTGTITSDGLAGAWNDPTGNGGIPGSFTAQRR